MRARPNCWQWKVLEHLPPGSWPVEWVTTRWYDQGMSPGPPSSLLTCCFQWQYPFLGVVGAVWEERGAVGHQRLSTAGYRGPEEGPSSTEPMLLPP